MSSGADRIPSWRWEDEYDGEPVDNEPGPEEELDFDFDDEYDKDVMDMFDNEALDWGGVDYG